MFAFPIPPGYKHRPAYDGSAFIIGSERLTLLVYEPGESGWTDDLTNFHENLAGGGDPIDEASPEYAVRDLRKRIRVPRPVIIDIGCSSGFLLRALRHAMPTAE